MVSDHFHPWISRQGQSPFVWSVLGGIAQATERMRIGTGVTCPTIRIHPAIIAQAAATAAAMLPGRFFLGVGTGEALNEHVLGDHWPEAVIRIEMLEEAVEVMRLLWQGGTRSHYGEYYVVENARLFTLPDEPPPVLVSAFGPMALDAAARIGDGYIGTSPDAELVKGFTTRRGKASRASPRCGSRGRRTRPRRGARCSSCGPPTACPGSSARICRRSSISSRPLRCSARTRWAPIRFYQREIFPKLD